MASIVNSRIESFSDPTRDGYKTVKSFLAVRRAQRQQQKTVNKLSRKLPKRVTGSDLRKLEDEFGWKLEVVDRSPSFAPYSDAKTWCLSVVNAEMKAWEGEELVVFDGDLISRAVKNAGWMHTCLTFKDSAAAALYEEQRVLLKKAVDGKRVDIASSASELLRQLNDGGDKVCRDAAGCRHIADTLLADMYCVDVSAEQLARCVLQHQASRAKVWFYFETDMFVEDTGVLTSMDGRYYIDRVADRLFIFPDGQNKLTYEWSFSSMMSYIMQSEVQVDGVKFIIEVHDSMPGVKFVQLTKAALEVPMDAVTDIHYYRPSGGEMLVVEQKWCPPAVTGQLRDEGQQFGRIVLPQEVVEKVCARVLSTDLKKLTLASARAAARDYMQQEVTAGGVVRRPRVYSIDVFEQLAQFAYKRALRERMEIEIESGVMQRRMGALRSNRAGWCNAAISVLVEQGCSVAEALLGGGEVLSRGMEVKRDYTYKCFPLRADYVVRNTIRKSGGDSFGARMVFYLPGFSWGKGVSPATSVTSSQVCMARARAYRDRELQDGADAVAVEVEEVRESVETDGFAPMGSVRDELVEKMKEEYDAHDQVVGARERVGVSSVSVPLTTEQPLVDDPVSAIMEDYRTAFPQLDEVDMSSRTHIASVENRVENFSTVSRKVNRDGDKLAPDQKVRKSKLLTAGGGRRAITQAETVLCFNKRVCNAPRAHLPRVYEVQIPQQFEKFASVCFRTDWKQIVARRCEQGMWSTRVSELGKNVKKTDSAKVSKMLTESFSVGEIDFTQWKAIVKPAPKPKMAESVAYEHVPCQTIIYQENKMENAYFSSMLSEFHDTLDECLRPEVCVNVRRDVSHYEKWFNSWRQRRETAGDSLRVYEADISQCDKSHTVYNWCVYLHFLKQFGMPDEMADLLSVMMGKKTASASMVAMLVEFMEELTSGGFHTISFNSIVTGMAVVNASGIERQDVVTLQMIGDDSLMEVLTPVDVSAASEYMRDVFNFESKFFESPFRYFCSRYYVLFDGYFFLMRDPLKLAENMGKHMTATASLEEQHQAYVDGTTHYDKREPCEALAVACAARHRLKCTPHSLVSGLSALRCKELFLALYEEEAEVLSA